MVFRLPVTLPSGVVPISSSPDPAPKATFEGEDPTEVPFSTSGVSSPFALLFCSAPVVFGHKIWNLICVGELSVLFPTLSLVGDPFTSLPSHSRALATPPSTTTPSPSAVIDSFEFNVVSHSTFVQSYATKESTLNSPATAMPAPGGTPPPPGL